MIIKRTFAYLIDIVLVLIFSILISWVLSLFGIDFYDNPMSMMVLPYLYFLILEKDYSCTVGKYCFSLRTASKNTEKLSWQQSSLKAMFKCGFLPFYIFIIVALIFSKDKNDTWYDKVTYTNVLEKKEKASKVVSKDVNNYHLHKSFLSQSVFLLLIIFSIHSILFIKSITFGIRVREDGITMDPTIAKDDRLYVKNLLNLQRNYERGDIATVFSPYFPNTSKGEIDFDQSLSWFDKIVRGLIAEQLHISSNVSVKRIVGLPGEEVEIVANEGVYIDGELLEASYSEFYKEVDKSYPKIKVPPNHYYILGDNINYCFDSKYYGPVPVDRFHGIVYKIEKTKESND